MPLIMIHDHHLTAFLALVEKRMDSGAPPPAFPEHTGPATLLKKAKKGVRSSLLPFCPLSEFNTVLLDSRQQ